MLFSIYTFLVFLAGSLIGAYVYRNQYVISWRIERFAWYRIYRLAMLGSRIGFEVEDAVLSTIDCWHVTVAYAKGPLNDLALRLLFATDNRLDRVYRIYGGHVDTAVSRETVAA